MGEATTKEQARRRELYRRVWACEPPGAKLDSESELWLIATLDNMTKDENEGLTKRMRLW
jgi:hypothetical protein